jgi:hypothetical protein
MMDYDVDMLRYLLAICTRQHDAGQSHNESQEEPKDERATEIVDTAMRLVHVCSTSEGVVQAVALQALKTWVEDYEMCVNICITKGNIVPTLLSTLHRSLPAATQAATAAYCASIAVILLRVFVRDGGTAGANAFLVSKGVETLLELIDAVACDERSLCLALYLLNDTTRRSMAVLEATVEAGAVRVVVGVLERPNISEATKFAALILNRWSLAAHYQNLIQHSGASDALLGVLKAGVTVISAPEDSSGDNLDPYTSAYALSAFAMVNQGNIEEIQRVLLADKDALFAISFAISHYEACFDGVGFPHLLMSQLIEGQAGDDILAELARLNVMQVWLKVKHVAVTVIERCIEQDVLDKLGVQLSRLLAGNPFSKEALEEVENYVLSAIALLQESLAPDFLPLLIPHGRLETLLSLFLRQVVETDETKEGKKAAKEWQRVEDCDLEGLVSGKRAKNCENISTSTCTPSILPSPSIPRFCFRSLDAETSPRLPKEPVLLKSSPVATHSSSTRQHTCAKSGSTAIAGLLRWCITIAGSQRVVCSGRFQIAQPPSKTLSSLLQSPPADGAAVGHLKAAAEVQYVHVNGRKRRAVGLETGIEPSSLSAGQLKCSDVGKKRYDSLCFVIGELETHAVGFVLESHSAVLRELLAGIDNTSERVMIPVLPGFSCDRMHQIFRLVVEWCYTGVVQCFEHVEDGYGCGGNAATHLEKALDLWKVADFLQMDVLQCYCEKALELRCMKRPELTVTACVRFATCNLSSRRLYRVVARYSLRRMLAMVEKGSEAVGASHSKLHEAFLPVVVLEEKKEVLKALVDELAAEIREILVELQAALAGLQR